MKTKTCSACGRENPEILSVCKYCKGKLLDADAGNDITCEPEIGKKLGTVSFRYDSKDDRLDFGFWMWVVGLFLAVVFLSILRWQSLEIVAAITVAYVFAVWGYCFLNNLKGKLFYVGTEGFLIREYDRKDGKIRSDTFYFYKDFTDVFYPATIHRNLVKKRQKKTYLFEIRQGDKSLFYQEGTFWSENSGREMFLQEVETRWSAYLLEKRLAELIKSGELAEFKDRDGKTVKIGIGGIVKDEMVFRPEEVEKFIFIGGNLSVIGKGYKSYIVGHKGKQTVIHINKLANKTAFMLLLQSLIKAEIVYYD